MFIYSPSCSSNFSAGQFANCEYFTFRKFRGEQKTVSQEVLLDYKASVEKERASWEEERKSWAAERKVWMQNQQEFRFTMDSAEMSTAGRIDTIKRDLKDDYKERLKELKEAWESEKREMKEGWARERLLLSQFGAGRKVHKCD